jgi:hypothetical protein
MQEKAKTKPEDRRAAALRENLQKRKEQSRLREAQSSRDEDVQSRLREAQSSRDEDKTITVLPLDGGGAKT